MVKTGLGVLRAHSCFGFIFVIFYMCCSLTYLKQGSRLELAEAGTALRGLQLTVQFLLHLLCHRSPSHICSAIKSIDQHIVRDSLASLGVLSWVPGDVGRRGPTHLGLPCLQKLISWHRHPLGQSFRRMCEGRS